MSGQLRISLCEGDNVRMECLTEETMDKYFELLKDTLSNNLMESPTKYIMSMKQVCH